MKNILILLLLIPFFGFAQIQDEYYRVSDWTFLPDSVVQLTDTTYSIYAVPANYNDPGSIDRIVGGYVVDFVGHRYVVIDSTDTHLTLFDIYKTGQAPQTGQIAHCYRSVGNGEADFIGSVDYSTLDESARWKINGADNELMWQKVKTKVPYLGAESDVDLGENSISADTFKVDGVPLLQNTFKQGNLGGAGNIFYSTGASSQPASGSVNQVIGGNTLTTNYVPKWDGNKFANSLISDNGTVITLKNTELRTNLDYSLSAGINGQRNATTNNQSNNIGTNGQFNATTNNDSNNIGHNGQSNAATNNYSNNVGNNGQSSATTNIASNNVGTNGQRNATTNNNSNNIGHNGQLNATINNNSNNIGHNGQGNATTNNASNNLGYNGFRFSSTGSNVLTIINGLGLGHNTRPKNTETTDEIVIGANAVGNGDSTVTIGSSLIKSNHFSGKIIANRFESTVPTGTPPLVVASTTVVDSLNAGLLDGKHAGDFELANVNIQRHITNDVDTVIGNEIQDLSRAGNTLSLSGDGTTVDLSDLVNPSLTGYRLKSDHDSLSALDEKSYNSLTDKPASLPASDVYLWAKAATKPTYTKSEVGLGNVDNTSDASKPISTATQTALNAKLAISDTTNKWQPKGTYLSSEVDGSTTNEIQDLSRAGNTLSLSNDATTVDLSDLVNPSLTGYRLKTDHDSLSKLDEKSYNSLTDKPNLTVYRTLVNHDSLSALDEKSYNSLTDKPASLPASDVYLWAKAATKPTYTKSEVGLGNVDNTSDASKPISTATQTALNAKLAISDTTNKWQPKGTYLSSEVDGSTTNEIQDLSRAGNTLSLSNDATTVDLSDLVNPSLTGYRLKTDHDSLSKLDEKSYNSLTDKPNLTVYRTLVNHDSLSALDEKSYNSLTDKPALLPASDVYLWAKAATKPTYTKSEVGLGNVDNTSDASKPISTATQTALNNLVPFSGADRDLDMGANSISADTFKVDGVPLLQNTFKQGNLGGAGNIFYSTGASSQPASGSLNQVIGGNSLTANYLPKWNGSKLANSLISDNGTVITLKNTQLRTNVDYSLSLGTNGQLNAATNNYSNNVGAYGQFNATTNNDSNNIGHNGQSNAATNNYSNNVGNNGQSSATTNIASNNVGTNGQRNATTNNNSNNIGHNGQLNATINNNSNNIGHNGQGNATTNNASNNLGYNGFRFSSTGSNVLTIINGLGLGHNTRPKNTETTDEIVIGANAVGNGDSTVTIGNSLIKSNHFSGKIIANRFESTVPTGTPPLVVASTTVVDSLNAGLLDGKHAGDFELANVNIQRHITNDVDTVIGNEIQDLSRAGNTLSLSGDGTTVDLSDLVNPSLTGYRLKSDHDSLSKLDEKSYNSLTDKPNLSVYLTSEVDGSTTNEIQDLSLGTKSGTLQPITISGGNTIDIDVADYDNSKTNEIQNLSRTGNTLSLSGDGTTVDLSDLVNPNLSGYATTTQLANQLSQTITNGVTTKSPSEDAVYDALTGKATVSGTTGYLAKITGANTLGNSLIQDNGTAISIGLPVQNNNTFQSINNIASVGASESGSSEIGAQTYGYWSTPTYTGTLLRQYGSSYAGTIAGITAKNLGTLIFQNTDTALIYTNGLAPIIMGAYSSPMSILNASGNYGVGTLTPAARVHSQSTTTQLRLGYDETKYTDLTVNSGGNLTISPTGGHTTFSDITGDSLVVANLKIPTGAGLNKVWTSDANGNGYWGAVLGVPKVGDYYGGGQVYYVSPSGTYGYCVYPSVIATNTYWSPTNNNAAIATNEVVGAGIANTTAIVAVFGAGNYAAYKVDTLNIGGYSDWALPSIGDADLIHDSLYSTFPTSNPTYYLCSNDWDTGGRMYDWFNGATTGTNKGTSGTQPELYGVIAVRRFVISTQSFNLSVSESDGSPAYSAINAIQFANCVLTQPTSNTVLVTPNAGTTANETNWNTAYNERLHSVIGSAPLYLSLSSNTLSGFLNTTLTNFGNTTPSVGYPYWNGSSYSYQAATTTYTLPTASSSTLGGVKINGNGMAIDAGGVLFQEDNNLTTRTPEVTDYIAFYDNSATAQGKMTLSTLGSLIGGSGAVTSVTGTAPIISSGGTTPAISISAATTSAAGSMSSTDKTKLNGFRSITPQSITTSASCATYCNFYTLASGSKTITFSNLIEGLSGQVEVAYSSASVITFAASGYTVMVASNIYNGTTGQVTSKSTGTAIYSYYVRNSKIYINGTQTYN